MNFKKQMKTGMVFLLLMMLTSCYFGQQELPETKTNAPEQEDSETRTEEIISAVDWDEDGTAYKATIMPLDDNGLIRRERLVLTDSTDGIEYVCEAEQLMKEVSPTIQTMYHTDDPNASKWYCEIKISDGNSVCVNMGDLEETSFTDTTLFNDMIFDEYYRFTLREDTIVLTYSCMTSYNETIAYIDLIVDFFDGEFCVREVNLRENVGLSEEIAARKSTPEMTDGFCTYQRYKEGWMLVAYAGDEENISIPAEYNGLPVIAIGRKCFEERTTLRTISLPEVREIHAYAFQNSSVAEVEAPNVLVVGWCAFASCTELREIELPRTYWIASEAFRLCEKLDKITLLEASVVKSEAFAYTALLTVDLPHAREIEGQAFAGCHNLTEIALPEVETMGNDLFFLSTGVQLRTTVGNGEVKRYYENHKAKEALPSVIYE